jgi:fructose-1,6-bisphosphatase I
MNSGPKGKVGITFSQHIAHQQTLYPEATGGLTALLQELMVAAKIISREVRKAGLVDVLGLTGKTNIQGEAVQILDDFANETIRNVITPVPLRDVSERSRLIPIPAEFLAVLRDDIRPLDWSSNIDANVSIGTIFSIHRKRSPGSEGREVDSCSRDERIAAGYMIYGAHDLSLHNRRDGLDSPSIHRR